MEEKRKRHARSQKRENRLTGSIGCLKTAVSGIFIIGADRIFCVFFLAFFVFCFIFDEENARDREEKNQIDIKKRRPARGDSCRVNIQTPKSS